VLFFGGGERLSAKWTAATVVLDDRTSAGASYLDLRLPERPAAGGLEAPAPAPAQTGAPPVQPQTPTAQP
jgi:cell division protein FtsQ